MSEIEAISGGKKHHPVHMKIWVLFVNTVTID